MPGISIPPHLPGASSQATTVPATDEDARQNALRGYAAHLAAERANPTSKPGQSAKSPPSLLRANSIPILKTPKERIRRTRTPSDQVSEGSTVTPRQSDVVANATTTDSDGTPASRHDSSHDSSHDSTRATGGKRKKGPGIKGKKLKKKGKTGKKNKGGRSKSSGTVSNVGKGSETKTPESAPTVPAASNGTLNAAKPTQPDSQQQDQQVDACGAVPAEPSAPNQVPKANTRPAAKKAAAKPKTSPGATKVETHPVKVEVPAENGTNAGQVVPLKSDPMSTPSLTRATCDNLNRGTSSIQQTPSSYSPATEKPTPGQDEESEQEEDEQSDDDNEHENEDDDEQDQEEETSPPPGDNETPTQTSPKKKKKVKTPAEKQAHARYMRFSRSLRSTSDDPVRPKF